MLAAFLLAACGQSEQPAKNEADHPGPAGTPAPGSVLSGQAIRVAVRPCKLTICGASCEQNEQILNAYAINPGGEIVFMDDRNLTFRPKEQSTFLVIACIANAAATQHQTTAMQQPTTATQQPTTTTQQQTTVTQQELSPVDRACITAAAGKLPTMAALEIKGSRAIQQPSGQGRRDSKLSNVKVEIDVSVAGQGSTYVFNCIRDDTLTVIQPLGIR